MTRFISILACAAVFWLGLTVAAFAQSGDDGTNELPTGEAGWCTVTVEAGAGKAECGFMSAAAACERQINSFYPKGRREFAGTRNETATTASCDFRTIPGIIELVRGIANVNKRCEAGYTRAGPTCRSVPKCTTCDRSLEAGNPINFVSGQKKDVRIDYQSADGRFVIKRHYNSAPFSSSGSPTSMAKVFGHSWYLAEQPVLSASIIHQPNFVTYNFSYPTGYSTRFSGPGEPRGDIAAGDVRSPFVVKHPDGPVSSGATGDRRVRVIHNNGKEYNFNFPLLTGFALQGEFRKPESIDFGEGYIQTYAYDDDNNLTSITDTYGRQARFEYHVNQWLAPNGMETDVVIGGVPYDRLQFELNGEEEFREPEKGLLKRITFPDGTYSEYVYDAVSGFNQYWDVKERLIQVMKHGTDGAVIHTETYHYEDARLPFALTGITDDAGIRFASWTYDEEGRANMSQYAGGVERVDIEYETAVNARLQTTRKVTNSLGHVKTYTVDNAVQDLGIVAVDGAATPDVKSTRETYLYATGGGKTRITDPLSRRENRSIDVRGFPLSKTYAVGTPEQFTATYQWHERFRRPTQTVQPGLTTDYIYDNDGRVLEMVQTDTSANAASPRTWTYVWTGPNLTSVDGPLPGDIDVSNFTYANEKLLQVENEVGHITEITAHNPIGAPARFIDPNGVETEMTYDARHRLTTIERAGAVTRITYSPTNLTTSITLPNGNRLGFEYNDGRQLIAITNGEGERVEYERNAMGGILSTRIPDSSGALQYTMTQVRDEINRVVRATGVNWTTSYEYDEMNNLTDMTDGRGNDWQQNFDNLDRLTEEIDPLGGTTGLDLNNQMDTRNPLTKVTDKRGIETQYVRNGFGEVIREINLEAGITEYIRDEAGRISQMTDARGVVSNYVYDGMDRLLNVTYPASAIDDITYGYDEGAFGIGELTSITEGFGITNYSYNDLAQMIRMTREIDGVAYECSYEYDLAGEVTAMVYPSGRRIEYARDGAARETQIRMIAPDGTATVLVDNISYKPFGPIDAMSVGDGNDLSIAYDQNYRATRLTRGGGAGQLMDYGFTYDEDSDITGLQDYVRPERSQTLGYDALSRLTSAEGGYGAIDYGYNAGDDRTSRDWTQPDGTQTSESYEYDPTTARLLLVNLEDTAGQFTPIREFDYHASGQVSSDLRGANAYLYGLNDRGRLTTITRNGEDIARYTHDESEQRIVKRADGRIVHYHYDLDGRLISETDGVTGEALREYVWLGHMPIAVIDGSGEGPDTACEEDIAALQARFETLAYESAQTTEEIAQLTAQNLDAAADLSSLELEIAQLEDQLTESEALIASETNKANNARALVEDRQRRIAFITRVINRVNPRRKSRIAVLEARLNVHVSRLPVFEQRLAQAEANVSAQTQLAEAQAETLAALHAERDALQTRLTEQDAQIESLTATLAALTEERAQVEAEIAEAEATCDPNAAGGLFYLHADHLGRPQFATDISGAVVWDMGESVTPFGDSVNLAGAFAQRLIFPGQYADVETGDDTAALSHNWHRTYDPTLGRYLQSDPIGLAGGLNRYAYVGGNPLGRWIRMGSCQFYWLLFLLELELELEYYPTLFFK